MRFVVYGAGAIGGVVGGCLHQAGSEVVLIARGDHLDAIARRGLRLETPNGSETLKLPVLAGPEPRALRADDVILLATKSQDTGSALKALRETLSTSLPVVCMQNGVENERKAARLFELVYGAVVMCPAEHLEPGVVRSYGANQPGQIDLGRYLSGTDELCRELCVALRAAGFDSEPREEIMRHKHAKLIRNLGNAVEAVCGPGSSNAELAAQVMDEGRNVLRAAGIEFEVPEIDDLQTRWRRWGVGAVSGRARQGGSTWQSVARGGRIETDYLNGEIAMRAHQHGLGAPLNACLQELAAQTVRERLAPGWITPEQVRERASARAEGVRS